MLYIIFTKLNLAFTRISLSISLILIKASSYFFSLSLSIYFKKLILKLKLKKSLNFRSREVFITYLVLFFFLSFLHIFALKSLLALFFFNFYIFILAFSIYIIISFSALYIIYDPLYRLRLFFFCIPNLTAFTGPSFFLVINCFDFSMFLFSRSSIIFCGKILSLGGSPIYPTIIDINTPVTIASDIQVLPFAELLDLYLDNRKSSHQRYAKLCLESGFTTYLENLGFEKSVIKAFEDPSDTSCVLPHLIYKVMHGCSLDSLLMPSSGITNSQETAFIMPSTRFSSPAELLEFIAKLQVNNFKEPIILKAPDQDWACLTLMTDKAALKTFLNKENFLLARFHDDDNLFKSGFHPKLGKINSMKLFDVVAIDRITDKILDTTDFKSRYNREASLAVLNNSTRGRLYGSKLQILQRDIGLMSTFDIYGKAEKDNMFIKNLVVDNSRMSSVLQRPRVINTSTPDLLAHRFASLLQVLISKGRLK